MTSFRRLIAAAIVALQLGVVRIVVSAQENNDKTEGCFDPRFDNLNATAAYSVPGFAPPGNSSSSSDSTWTFSTGAVNYGGNTTQRFWVNTSPAIEIDSDSLTYQGCILAFISLNTKVPAGGHQDTDGDCTSALGEKCVAAILKNANDIGRNLSAFVDEDFKRYNQRSGLGISFSAAQCSDFAVRDVPTECGGTRSEGPDYGIATIGHVPKLYNNDTLALERGVREPAKCPNVGTNGTAATSPILELYTASVLKNTTKDLDFNRNYSTYDQWLNRVLPVLVPVWSKDPKQAWSDSRLICMRPEAVVKQAGGSGSGNATSTQQSGSSAPAPSGSAAQPSAPVPTGAGVRSTFGSIFFISAPFLITMMII